jgi:hypothetical protein
MCPFQDGGWLPRSSAIGGVVLDGLEQQRGYRPGTTAGGIRVHLFVHPDQGAEFTQFFRGGHVATWAIPGLQIDATGHKTILFSTRVENLCTELA